MATGTQTEVVMPQMGVSVSEGTITKWLKQEGEAIEADETLLEISTDKVDTEVPSPATGVLQKIVVPEGETVAVGTVVGIIAPEGAEVETPAKPAAPAEAPPEPATQAAADEANAAAAAETPAAPAAEPSPAPERPAAPPAPAAQPSGNGKTFVSPVVARIASEHGIDPSQVPGTGAGGRVTKKDILSFVESGGTTEAPAPAVPPTAPEAAPAPQAVAAPAPPSVPEPEAAAGESFEPVTPMRRGVMEHMRKSVDTSAHVTSAIEVDLSRVVAIRGKLKKEYESAYGVNPTYLAFIARATVDTLKDYPWVNGEIRGEKIVTRNYVNLGIAVSLQDGKGLIVPVIRNAEGLNLLGMAKAIADLAERARTKKLLPDDVQGGTFTITNPGGYGTFHGTPIINQPQVGILGTYALVKRPVVVQDDRGQDVIAIRPIMNLTLTYDHRLVDGAYAGGFLRDLRERLETSDEGAY